MSVEYYRKQIVDLRARIANERESKKKDNEYYARMIKSATSPSTKATYRKSKIDKAEAHDRHIDYLERQIDSAKISLARERARE